MNETSTDKPDPSDRFDYPDRPDRPDRTLEHLDPAEHPACLKTHVSSDVEARTTQLQQGADEDGNNKSSPRELTQSQLLGELNVLHVRRVVAGNPNTPRQVLLRLSEDKSVLIRSAVAANPKTPIELLRVLSDDKSSEVRLAVAENNNAPWDLLLKVAGDTDADVRFGMAENPYMPEDILLSLLQDENPFVAWRALKTLDMLNPDARIKLHIRLQHASSESDHREMLKQEP